MSSGDPTAPTEDISIDDQMGYAPSADLPGIIDPKAEQEALITEAWSDVKLSGEIYIACVDLAFMARQNEDLARKVMEKANDTLSNLLEQHA